MKLSGPGRAVATPESLAARRAVPARSLLDRALARLDALGPPGLSAAVSRVELDGPASDPHLVLTVGSASGERWFRFTSSELVELRPGDDRALPLAAFASAAPVLSYRPGRRLVLLRETGPAVEKGYRRSRFAAAAARHELVATLGGRIGGLRLPRLDRRRDEAASLLLEKLSGEPLRLEPASIGCFRTLGRALRGLQEIPVRAPALPRHAPADELAVLDRWAARVCVATGARDERWLRARAAAAARAEALPTTSCALSHRDLHDGQLMVSAEGLALVDFDLLALADPALDAGNLLAHLELRRLQRFPGVDDATAAAARRAFLGGLGREEEGGFRSRLGFYRGTSLLRLALVYELRPRWRRLAPALAEEGARCLDTSD